MNPDYLGKYDYLGFESGERRLPEQLPNLRGFTNVNDLVTESQRFNNLFGDRYNGKALPNQITRYHGQLKKILRIVEHLVLLFQQLTRNNQKFSIPKELIMRPGKNFANFT
jgi:hypothetical protein